MPDYDSYLVPKLADLATALKPYINTPDFSVHKVIIDTAFDQVIQAGGIVFKSNGKEVRMHISQLIADGQTFSGTKIAEAAKNQDFEWRLYDKCVALCQTHGLKFTRFQYLSEPQPPEFVKEHLDILTVADIKYILKANGHITTGKRDELVDRLWVHFPIKDTESMLNKRYQENLAKYQERQMKLKYELLASHVVLRAYFLRKIANENMFFRGVKLSLDFRVCEEDDAKLAKLLDGTGYDDVLLFGKINKLLPLFPRDLVDVTFDYKLR